MDKKKTILTKTVEVNQICNETNSKSLEDPLGISWPPDFLKEEPEVTLDVDETENIVATSTEYASDSTWLIQNSGEIYDISFEESFNEGMVHNELNNTAEELTHFTKLGVHEQGLFSPENKLTGMTPRQNVREKEFPKFSCSSCLQSFPSKYKLIMHVFIHIDGVQPPKYVCKSCGEVFPNNVNYNEHLAMNDDDKASCAVINKKFGCSDDPKNIMYLEGDLEVSFMAETERQSSTQTIYVVSKKSLNDPCKTHSTSHSVEKLDIDNDITSSTTVNSNAQIVQLPTERPHKCHFCERSFFRLSHLKSHVYLHLGKRPHKCDVCGKSFARSYHLKLHALTHTGTKPHKCNFCDKSFTQLGALKSHVLLHTGNRPYKCEVCGKSFVQVGSLRSHALLHTGSTPYKCEICGKSFVELRRLKGHLITHTGIRPHKCDTCGKSYTHLSNLKSHVLSHTTKEPFKCEICGDHFTELRLLKSHILIHTGTKQHNCDICGKSFRHVGAFNMHALIHTGLKPHKCDVCGKSFTQLGNLKNHAVLHTGNRPYKCEICGRSYPLFSHLKRHTLRHTEKKPLK